MMGRGGDIGLSRRGFAQALVAAGLAGAAAGARAASPEAPWEEEGIVPCGGGAIHWAALGKGPPLVMMPKLGGWVADWRHVAPLLAASFRVVVVDPPGHGGSRMAGPPPFAQTLPESAAMLRAALQALGIGQYRFVGNSLGGCIGLVSAALWPDDIGAMVILSSSLISGLSRADVAKKESAADADFDAAGRPIARDFATMNAQFGLTREIHDEMNASRAVAGAWVRASQRGVAMSDIPAYLPRIKARTLLVYGSQGFYPAYRKKGLELIPNAEATAFDGGSFLHQEQPGLVAQTIRGFFG